MLIDDLRSTSNDTLPAAVERLVEAGAREDERLDYKQVLTLVTDEQKLELARDLSAFANARGGWLVFGVRERRENGENTGEPEALIALSGVNPDKLERQLLDIFDAHLQPRVPGIMVRIGAFDDGHVVAVGVPRSWRAPHMVKNGTFWVRQGARKRQYDVTELRAAFLEADELGNRVRRLRDERLGRIIASDTPAPVTARGFMVVHVVPVAAVEGRFTADLDWAERNPIKLWPTKELAAHWTSRFNIDGFLAACRPGGKEAFEYTQLLRSGALEYVDAYSFNRDECDGCYAETRILDAVRMSTNALREQHAPWPVVTLVSLHGVESCKLTDNDHGFRRPGEQPNTFDRDTIVLPDVLLREENDVGLEIALKPAFDALWQAAGWPKSRGYDSEGKFISARHRSR
jgi:hypothetical protein